MKNISSRRRLAEVEIEELSTLLGPPPILSSENEAHYKRILKEFYACLGPADFFCAFRGIVSNDFRGS